MYSDRELRAIQFTIGKAGGAGNEGGFSNRKNDKGGATMSGFTIGTLRTLSAQILGHSFDKDHDGDVDVNDLKLLEYDDMLVMADTYYSRGLDAMNAEHDKTAIKTFDFSFNFGMASGIKLLQEAANRCAPNSPAIGIDGKLGPRSLFLINQLNGPVLLNMLVLVAKEHYQAIVNRDPTQQENLHGWFNRAERMP